MDYGLNIIFGAAGAGKWRENAEATAELLNATRPYLIFTGTVHADPGCPLYEMMQDGTFVESTFGEYLDEEELLVSRLELDDCRYFGLHPSNIVRVDARLPRDKAELLREIRRMRERLSEAQLSSRPRRFGEGAILI